LDTKRSPLLRLTASAWYAAFTYRQTPQDVCFVFPATETKLWASSKVLVDQSAYYRSLLGSNFSESTTHTSPEGSDTPESKADETIRLYEESDDETDAQFADEIAKRACESVPNLPHKKVIINDAAFSTYQAILVWMSSSYIRFAPLRSRMENNASDENESRLQDIIKMVEANPETSLPASPKSVYRLAHLLELKDLQEAALANLSSQLTAHNAATELFSDVASAYPAFRDVVLKYVVKKWSGVRASEAWKKIKEQADGHMLPAGAAYTALLLSESTR
jgi:hypothetical protein